MTRYIILLFTFFISVSAHAQLTPEVTSWVLNETGAKGYSGIASNVQVVQYSADWVYVSCTCIPGYDIGPWKGNPNTPANQNFVFKITRKPVKNTGTATATPLGHIGVWSNGVERHSADERNLGGRDVGDHSRDWFKYICKRDLHRAIRLARRYRGCCGRVRWRGAADAA